jgi:hypothetical protein
MRCFIQTSGKLGEYYEKAGSYAPAVEGRKRVGREGVET